MLPDEQVSFGSFQPVKTKVFNLKEKDKNVDAIEHMNHVLVLCGVLRFCHRRSFFILDHFCPGAVWMIETVLVR